MLRDNAQNMTKAMQECGLASLGCMAYTLQLAVNKAVLSQRSIIDCASISRKIVGHFRHSQLATFCLQSLQKQLGMKEARLQQDVLTRWNSTFYMMRSLLGQRRAWADLPGWHGVATATLKKALPPRLPPQLKAQQKKKKM